MPTLKTAVFLAPDGRKCAIGVKSIETLEALQLLDGKSVTTIRKRTFWHHHSLSRGEFGMRCGEMAEWAEAGTSGVL